MTELEKMIRAKDYIEKLANGIDPLTDCEMREDKVLNQVRISRCLFYVSEVLGKVIENGGEVGKIVFLQKMPFSITDAQLASVTVSQEPVGVTIIAKRISAVLDENVTAVAPTHITNWLLSKGYFEKIFYSNRDRKIATPKGEEIGIFTVDSVSPEGVPIKKNIYNAEAQRFVIDHIVEIENEMSKK